MFFFMQGASPLASPGAGRGTALDRQVVAVPGGGLAFLVAGSPCHRGTRRGACLPCRLPILPLACFLAPIPLTPFPAGRGETISLFCRGLRPRHPGIRPLTALTATAAMVPSGGLAPLVAGSPCRHGTLWGGLPSLSPAYPAFNLLSRPHPPNPLPNGKGEIFSFFMQGASPLASPGAGRSAALARLALAVPRGGRALLVAGSPCCYGSRRGQIRQAPEKMQAHKNSARRAY